MEYGHINFSDYTNDLEDKRPSVYGKEINHFYTFGYTYKNDMLKRKYIIETYPNVMYIVAWLEDFKRKDLRIETLQKPYKKRMLRVSS